LTSAPVFIIIDEGEVLTVYTDASRARIRAVLMQHAKVIAYESRQLKPYEKATDDLEQLAVVFVLKMWRHYLLVKDPSILF